MTSYALDVKATCKYSHDYTYTTLFIRAKSEKQAKRIVNGLGRTLAIDYKIHDVRKL